jgi:hypothetical protein
MDARKTWLKELASSPTVHAWAADCAATAFPGTTRVQTRNTTYLFRNGTCFAVTHSDPERPMSSDLVGMRLVGWLMPGSGEPRLSRSWLPGAKAVLWGARGQQGLPVALTSRTTRFAQFTSSAPVEGRERPSFDHALNQTFTRINLPMPGSAVRPIARPAPPPAPPPSHPSL